MEKLHTKRAPKVGPDPFLTSVKTQNSHCRKDCFKNMMFYKGIIKKPLKKLTLFFISNQTPFNEQDHKNKRGLKLLPSHSSGY